MGDSDDQLASTNDRLMARNHALAEALSRAGKELNKARAQLAQLAQPPMTFATMVRVDSCRTDELGVEHACAEVIAGTRRMIVPVAPNFNVSRLSAGSTVVLNESMVLVEQRDVDGIGMSRTVAQAFDAGRLLVRDAGGNLAVLEETPDVTFADIGGLDSQIGRIRDAVQLPFAHLNLFKRYRLRAPKGVLLYGPPGNGKTLIAKAVAHALAEETGAGGGVFLSVKGPELLNKFVGESERLIRLMFKRARERASGGRPVVVFIDEMDSLLRTRGSGVSSDVETTIVPQFLTELDGVESLDNVMVIGASNRIDMIDPAALRPGRLDVKIRVDRPDRQAALAIVKHYLTDDLPHRWSMTSWRATNGVGLPKRAMSTGVGVHCSWPM